MKIEATVTNSAVPSIFTVAPIGKTNLEILNKTHTKNQVLLIIVQNIVFQKLGIGQPLQRSLGQKLKCT